MMAEMDAENPIVQLCVEGMRLEQLGRHSDAAHMFECAWERSGNPFERSVAAHYVARHQTTPEETLRWNQRALEQAQAADPSEVVNFYPSLYLNLGWAWEQAGNREEAQRHYGLAAESGKKLPEDSYRAVVEDGIRRGLERTAAPR